MSIRADRFMTETRTDVINALNLIEQAQAIVAARLQEYNSIDDKTTMADEYDWNAVDMTKAKFIEGMTALAEFADILDIVVGDTTVASALYKFKIELS